jgi:hypothetical protein
MDAFFVLPIHSNLMRMTGNHRIFCTPHLLLQRSWNDPLFHRFSEGGMDPTKFVILLKRPCHCNEGKFAGQFEKRLSCFFHTACLATQEHKVHAM